MLQFALSYIWITFPCILCLDWCIMYKTFKLYHYIYFWSILFSLKLIVRRQTDWPTDIAIYRAAIADKNRRPPHIWQDIWHDIWHDMGHLPSDNWFDTWNDIWHDIWNVIWMGCVKLQLNIVILPPKPWPGHLLLLLSASLTQPWQTCYWCKD